MIRQVQSDAGVRVAFRQEGSGPPLVLVHGSFSDEVTNWEFVLPMLRRHFTVYAMARRGRGGTDETIGHTVEQEAMDVLAVIAAIPEPVFLLGHSYGAMCSLVAAGHDAGRIRKLVLYEPPWPGIVPAAVQRTLERLAAESAWDEFAFTFFRDALRVPVAELDALRATSLWPPIVADAPSSLEDLRAVRRFDFAPERFRGLDMPVLLQTGSESPDDLYIIGALAEVLPNARIGVLAGQAHEGMTTAPEQYAEAVRSFLLDSRLA